MKKLTIRVGTTVALGALGLAGFGASALADGGPPSDPNKVGTLTLKDGSGASLTDGSLDTAIAKAVGDAQAPAGTQAALFAYVYGTAPSSPNAVASFASAGQWSGAQLTASTDYSVTATATFTAGAESLAQFVATHTLPGDGLVELRLYTSKPGQPISTRYDALDIYVDKDAGTWTTDSDGGNGGSQAVSTTTTITATPGSVTVGGSVTLAATVTASSGTPAGSVQFKDNGAVVGSPIPVDSSGKATTTVTVSTAGSHSYTAEFTAANAADFGNSTSTTPFVVTAASTGGGQTQQPPAVAPVASSVTEKIAKKVKHTKKATITVTVTAAGAVPTGKVTVFDGKKKLATGTLKNGKVSIKLKKLKKGKHKIKATYAGTATVLAGTSKTTTVTSK